MPAKIALILIMLSSIYSWQFASLALILFAVYSLIIRNREVRNYIAEKNISVKQMWDVKYYGGMQSLVVERPTDCALIIDNNSNLIILVGKVEKKIPLDKINRITLSSKKVFGRGKLFILNYTDDIGKKVDVIFSSVSSTIAETIMESKRENKI